MITKCNVMMRNCYGISSLDYEFEFTYVNKRDGETYNTIVAIYAPNGLMKTSMADSFQDYSNGKMPADRVYSENKSEFSILDQDGNKIPNNAIFVVESINEVYKSERMSTLLASDSLKAKYDEVYRAVQDKSETLLKALRKKMEMRSNIDNIYIEDLGRSGESFVTALGSVERQVDEESYLKEFSNVSYKILFTDKNVYNLFSDTEFKDLISEYADVYQRLLSESRFFRQGVFNHTNAADVAKNLAENGWFEVGHTVKLKSKDGDDPDDITDRKTLEKYIDDEKVRILSDPTLEEMFAKIDDKFDTIPLKKFRDHLLENRHVIAELNDVGALKRKICTAYLSELKAEYTSLMEEYDGSKEKIKLIVDEANTEATSWDEVLREFNDRFSVPFKVRVTNKSDVVLGVTAPQLEFVFQSLDGKEERVIEQKSLLNVLSNGERRAFYILNIIFEVKARIKDGQETVIIFDDIADSFDYKNKYAIIEYLYEISNEENFRMIVLSHNFDFYRTIKSRLPVSSKCRLIAERYDDSIKLIEDNIGENPFRSWIKNLNDPKSVIGCIPFVRNIAEYTGNDFVYMELTKILHATNDSKTITFNQVKIAFGKVLTEEVMRNFYDADTLVISEIDSICKEISASEHSKVDLLEKIVLSIGIRLAAERFLIEEIGIHDVKYVKNIKGAPTGKLVGKFREIYSNNDSAKRQIEIVKRVGLMTPQNIHVNSFMFEPILDMSPDHLKKLYHEVINIKSP